MARKRTYGDGCAVTHALELIGERWALLVVRELLFGPKRFTDLRTGLPGVSADVLTQRLTELQEAGIVQRRKLAPPAGSWIYELTRWGQDLDPILTALARWSTRSPTMPTDRPISVDSLVLSLKVLFDARAARGLSVDVGLRLGEDRFAIRIAEGRIEVARDDPDAPDVILETDAATFGALVRGHRTLADALGGGEVSLTGPRAKAQRFLGSFPFPGAATG